jgi:hypothetical protein
VASQDLIDLLGLVFQRFMSNDLQQLMEFCQTAPQARLVRSPSHLEVSSVVACAVEGKTEKRKRLSASPVPFGVTLSKATEGHQTGSLNLSQFVEDQNGPAIGQNHPSSLCWQG